MALKVKTNTVKKTATRADVKKAINKSADEVVINEGDFKGKPVLSFYRPGVDLDDEDSCRKHYLMAFGVNKAKLFLDHLDAIKDFANKH